ncbi:MAG: hypothetical protein H6553_06470 [Chitinophagales bacterium]|nr:hypothetical protein [Chitinophagales bacterium]
MKPYQLFSSLISFFILVLFPINYSDACADGGYSEIYYSMFTPEIANTPNFTPYFFSYDYYYGNIDRYEVDEEKHNQLQDDNIKAWQQYFNNQLTEKQVSELMKADAKATQQFLSTSKNNILSQYQLKFKNEFKSFYNYWYYALQCEKNAYLYTGEYSWDLQYKSPNNKNITNLINQLKIKYDSENNAFLKQRYAYQILRMYFYNFDFLETIKWFNSCKDLNKNNGYIFYRSIQYVSGALYRLKKYAAANYMYSVLFKEYAPLQKEAMAYFHPQEESDWQESLELAKKGNTEIELWTMLGYYADPLRAIEAIQQLDASSKYSKLLATRFINTLEVNLFDTDTYRDTEKYSSNNKTQLKQAINTFKNFVDLDKSNNNFWNTALSYLYFLDEDYHLSEQTVQKVNLNNANDDLIGQVKVIEFINKVYACEHIDASFENSILDNLKYIINNNRNNYYYYYDNINKTNNVRTHYVYQSCMKILSDLYAKQGENLKAELCFSNDNFINSISNIDAMTQFMQQNKNPFYQTLIEQYRCDVNCLTDLWATRLAQEGKLDEAIAKFKEIPNEAQTKLLANPFNAWVNDCHDCDFKRKQTTVYTKLSFLETMKKMETTAKNNPTEAAINYFLMGNGYYNITHFGNARMFYNYASDCIRYSSYSFITNWQDNEPIFEEYRTDLNQIPYNCDLAKKYYKKAMDLATDKNLKAKCCWMLAKCEMNDYYESDKFIANKNKDIDFVSGYYYKLFKQNYSDTKYYQEVIKSCSYYNAYVQ